MVRRMFQIHVCVYTCVCAYSCYAQMIRNSIGSAQRVRKHTYCFVPVAGCETYEGIGVVCFFMLLKNQSVIALGKIAIRYTEGKQ